MTSARGAAWATGVRENTTNRLSADGRVLTLSSLLAGAGGVGEERKRPERRK
jgi:hypothetical protein